MSARLKLAFLVGCALVAVVEADVAIELLERAATSVLRRDAHTERPALEDGTAPAAEHAGRVGLVVASTAFHAVECYWRGAVRSGMVAIVSDSRPLKGTAMPAGAATTFLDAVQAATPDLKVSAILGGEHADVDEARDLLLELGCDEADVDRVIPLVTES